MNPRKSHHSASTSHEPRPIPRPRKSYPTGSRSPFYGSDTGTSPGPTSTSGRDITRISYIAEGGGKVDISFPINPWQILGLRPNATYGEVKMAFKNMITQSERQNRAMVSIANHILTSTTNRYERQKDRNTFFIKNADHFMFAASGDATKLGSLITKRKGLVEDTDEHGRSLLYLACKSGFYDLCKLLLQKGASVNQIQKDGSTPLHGAAYYGHTLVVGLLLECGAKTDIKNRWGSTALDEGASNEIRRFIQTAPQDIISSLAVKLKERQLVANVRPIEFKKKIIAKELLRDPRSLDRPTRAKWDTILSTWSLTWHGTRFKNVVSIMEKGLIPAGTDGIKPPAGHFTLGREWCGIKNWAAAIFLSPSIFYSSHAAYSERVLSRNEQWCILVKAYCKPESYKAYDPTVFKYEKMEGEPDLPEYRVPVTGEDRNVILRVESSRNVVVRSLVFVRVSVLENQEISFEDAVKIFKD